MEYIIKVGKKGITVIPKKLREAIGIEEESEIKAQLLPFGILLRPLIKNPVEVLATLSITPRKKTSVESIRELRRRIDLQIKRES
jgi:AbrB family looped-hinge helix DNA binding protein